MDRDIDYFTGILLNAIIALRNNANEEKSTKLTKGLLTKSDWYVLVEYMEDAINQSEVDYGLIDDQLVHFLNTDSYWIKWMERYLNN